MRKQLLCLMRHAKSDHGDAALSDHARPLNPRGRRDAPTMANWLEGEFGPPDRILASDSTRTLETAERMNASWTDPVDVIPTESLYLASAESILWAIAESNGGVSKLLVLGHNPGFSSVASYLANSRIEMATAAIAVFEASFEDDQGESSPLDQVGRAAECRLLAFVSPKTLPSGQ